MTGIGLSPAAMVETNEGGTLRNSANAAALPRSPSSQNLSSMPGILTRGYALSISKGKFSYLASGYVIKGMQTVFETRKQRLRMLKEKYASWAELNEAIGWTRTDPRLSQIHSESIRSDRGTPFVMGDPTARLIEEKLKLDEGWMDTPPTYSELHSDDRITHVMRVMEAMPEWKRDQAMRLIDTIAEPTPKRGNGD